MDELTFFESQEKKTANNRDRAHLHTGVTIRKIQTHFIRVVG